MSKVAIVIVKKRKTNPRQKSVGSFSRISHSTKTKETKKVKLDRVFVEEALGWRTRCRASPGRPPPLSLDKQQMKLRDKTKWSWDLEALIANAAQELKQT